MECVALIILSYGGFPDILVFMENFFSKIKISKIVKEIANDKSQMLKKPGLFYRESDEPRLRNAMYGIYPMVLLQDNRLWKQGI